MSAYYNEFDSCAAAWLRELIKQGLIADGVVCSGDTSESINANETQEARVMRLKGYGNAIVPAVAAEFIKAFMNLNNNN